MRMTRFSAYAVAAAVSLASGGVARADVSYPGDPMIAIERTAACAVRSDRAGSRLIAAAYPASPAEREAMARPKIAACLQSGSIDAASPAGALFAGEVARQLYVKTGQVFSSDMIRQEEGVLEARRNHPYVAGEIGSARDVTILAVCLVEADPEAADRLMRAKPGSDGETRMFDAVLQTLSSCVETGKRLALDRKSLHASVSRAFYRYVYSPETLRPG